MKHVTKIVLMVALLVALTTSVAVAATIINCSTQSGNTCTGTSGDDNITGTNDDETINALGGNDVVAARGDDDTVNGDNGKDKLTGEGGCDTIDGGNGKDTLDAKTNDNCQATTQHPNRHDTVNAIDNLKDKIVAGDQKRDDINCDSGLDKLVSVDSIDRVNGNTGSVPGNC